MTTRTTVRHHGDHRRPRRPTALSLEEEIAGHADDEPRKR